MKLLKLINCGDGEYIARVLGDSNTVYALYYNKKTGEEYCSCMGFTTHRHCKHIEFLKEVVGK